VSGDRETDRQVRRADTDRVSSSEQLGRQRHRQPGSFRTAELPRTVLPMSVLAKRVGGHRGSPSIDAVSDDGPEGPSSWSSSSLVALSRMCDYC
jgi:hypothetical protein